MPTYRYRCIACGEVFEVRQTFEEEPVTICSCGKPATRVYSSPFIEFRGSGFYSTDNAS